MTTEKTTVWKEKVSIFLGELFKWVSQWRKAMEIKAAFCFSYAVTAAASK